MIMEAFFIYILKVAVLTAAFGILYHYLLKKETFHRFNRVVLAASLLLAYILPLCVVTISKSGRTPKPKGYYPEIYQFSAQFMGGPSVPSIVEFYSKDSQEQKTQTAPTVDNTTQTGKTNYLLLTIGIIYAAGMLFVLGSRVISAVKVRKIIKRGRTIESTDKCNVIVSDSDVQPFSWMNDVVLPNDPAILNDPVVVEHEKAHIAFGHSYELLIFDIITFVQWFNPAVWLMRRDMCAVHEFQVDAAVLEKGYDRKDYQYSLLNHAVGLKAIAIACGFKLNSLRDRIGMMNRPASSVKKVAKIIYIPLIALLVILIWARKNKYVDMGTGVLWATCNLGASHPQEAGGYYAWGETDEKDTYSLNNYAWKDSSAHIPLEPQFDAANVKLGKGWRIPTHVEWEDLLRHSYFKWVTIKGVKGLLLESSINGNTLFLPVTNSHIDDKTTEMPIGEYWTNTAVDAVEMWSFDYVGGHRVWHGSTMSRLNENKNEKALPKEKASMVYFDSINLTIANDYRHAGLAIRPVKIKKDKTDKIRNLESMSEKKRNKILTRIAREAVLQVGPDYYREDTVPVILGPGTFTWKGTTEYGRIAFEGRKFYSVFFPYDNSREEFRLAYNYTAQVNIWADNGEPAEIFFGNGQGYTFISRSYYELIMPDTVFTNKNGLLQSHKKIYMPFQYQQYHSGKVTNIVTPENSKQGASIISGFIRDDDGNPIHKAVVMLVNPTGGTVQSYSTNPEGFYALVSDNPQNRIGVTYAGYICVDTTRIEGTTMDFVLEP